MNEGTLYKSQIRLNFDKGLDDQGELIEVSRNLNNIDPTATSEEIKKFVTAYASLTNLNYQQVIRINEVEL